MRDSSAIVKSYSRFFLQDLRQAFSPADPFGNEIPVLRLQAEAFGHGKRLFFALKVGGMLRQVRVAADDHCILFLAGDAPETFVRIVTVLPDAEGGGLTLDESVKLFEAGAALSRFCSGELDKAERKIVFLEEEEKQHG